MPITRRPRQGTNLHHGFVDECVQLVDRIRRLPLLSLYRLASLLESHLALMECSELWMREQMSLGSMSE